MNAPAPSPALLKLRALVASPDPAQVRQGIEMMRSLDAALWRGSDLLKETRLRRQDLSGLDLTDCSLWDADLTDATLDGANLSRVWLRNALLFGASFRGADLTGAHLERVRHIGGADFTGARLAGANIGGPWGRTQEEIVFAGLDDVVWGQRPAPPPRACSRCHSPAGIPCVSRSHRSGQPYAGTILSRPHRGR